MSSKEGPRASGTDGSDWKHREKVAVQYVTSVKYKNAMKRTVLYHGMLGATILATTVMAGFNSLYVWQALWLAASPSCLLGFRGICKNNTNMLNLYKLCLGLCAIPAVIWGVVATLGYLPHKELYIIAGLGKPAQFLMPANNWVIYFLGSTTLMSHVFSLLCIGKLTHAWNITSRKSKSQ